ncbi:MAG: SH3 domain-containing protein [Chitinispirillaceae bacterium]
MERYRFLHILAFMIILTSSLCAQYIKVDMANVRGAPSSDASIVARLRMNTSVNADNSEGEWQRIADVAYEGKKYDVSGWIHNSLLISKPVDASLINRELEKCTTIKDSIPWLERRAALEPDNSSNLEMLRDAYERNGEKSRSEAVATLIQKKESVFLACDFGARGINILGEIDSSNNFHALTWRKHNLHHGFDDKGWVPNDTSDERIMKRASSLRIQLSGLFWHDPDKKRYYIPRVDQAPADSLILSGHNDLNNYISGPDAPVSFFIQLPSEWASAKKLLASSEIMEVEIPRDRITQLEKQWKKATEIPYLDGISHRPIIQQRYGPFRFERMGDGSAFYIVEYTCEPVNEDFTYGLYGWDLFVLDGEKSDFVKLYVEEWGS